jgi:hypothetical protein
VASLVDPARTPKVELLVTAGEALTEIVKRRWAGKKLYQGKHFRILEDPMPRKMLNQVANGSCV